MLTRLTSGGRSCSLWGLAFLVAIALVCESCALILQSGLPCRLAFPGFLLPADTQPVQRQLQRPPGYGKPSHQLVGVAAAPAGVPCARHAFLFGAARPPVLGTDIAGEQREKVSGEPPPASTGWMPRAPVQRKSHHLPESETQAGARRDFLGGWIPDHREAWRSSWVGK